MLTQLLSFICLSSSFFFFFLTKFVLKLKQTLFSSLFSTFIHCCKLIKVVLLTFKYFLSFFNPNHRYYRTLSFLKILKHFQSLRSSSRNEFFCQEKLHLSKMMNLPLTLHCFRSLECYSCSFAL